MPDSSSPSRSRLPSAAAPRIALVALAWLVALAATLGFHSLVQRTAFVFFWLAVLFAAWYGGLVTAIVVAIASVFAVDFFLIPPLHAFAGPNAADVLSFSIFVAAAALVSTLASAAARAQRESHRSTTETEEANARLRAAAHDADVARVEADAARARVTSILNDLGDAVSAFDADWRCIFLNPAAADGLAAMGRDARTLLGRVIWNEMPELRATAFEREARRAVAEHVTVDFEERIGATGRWLESRAVPGVDGTLTVYSRDVTRRHERRATDRLAAERARGLLALSSGLSEATTPAEVAAVIFREGLAAVGADAGSLGIVHAMPDESAELEIVHTTGYAVPLVERYRRFPLRAGRPTSDAILARAPCLVRSSEEWRSRYAEVAAETQGMDYEAFAAVPVLSGGRALAAISFSFREAQSFDEAARTFLATLGEQCGLALERARAFEAERVARTFSAETLASIRDAFIAFDLDFRYTYVNARAEQFLRQPATALLGRVLWDVSPKLDGTPFGLALRRVAETRREETLEEFSSFANAWLEVRIYPAQDGLTVFHQDVTARRRAREASEFLARASGLLNASLDFERTLGAVAEAAVPTLGDWCAMDLLRDPASAAWPPQIDRVAIVHHDPEMVARGLELLERYPTDWSESGLAGAIRSATPLLIPAVTDEMVVAGARDAAHLELLRALSFSAIIIAPLVARGRTLGALTLCMTESGRRYDEADFALAQELAQRAAAAVDNARLYRETERARRDAEAANEAKSQFLSTMSHELRTPLNALLGYTELMDAGIRGPVTDEQRVDLSRMRRSAKVLMSLVTDVLNFARVEAGRVEFRITEVPLAGVLSQMEALVSPQMRAKRLEYVQESCDDGIRVRADAERLQQVLTNLLTNAIKFTGEGGRIAVRCDVSATDRTGASRLVHVRVADSGRGIDPGQLGRIFEPFVQVDRHLTHDSQQGVGLGLAIARDLARQMGGDLTAESAVGAGSTFTLTLPVANAG